MAVLVFALRGVPEDEADDVRSLLAEGGIAFHETGAGLLGISVAGLWVSDRAAAAHARTLIEDYQRSRAALQRAAYQQARRTLIDVLRERPLLFLLYLAVVLGVLYLSTIPFWQLGP